MQHFIKLVKVTLMTWRLLYAAEGTERVLKHFQNYYSKWQHAPSTKWKTSDRAGAQKNWCCTGLFSLSSRRSLSDSRCSQHNKPSRAFESTGERQTFMSSGLPKMNNILEVCSGRWS